MESTNSVNHYCVCLACEEGTPSNLWDINCAKFQNRKERVKNHLKECLFFNKKYGQEKVEEILDVRNDPKFNKKSVLSVSDTASFLSDFSTTQSEISTSDQNSNETTLCNWILQQSLSKSEQEHFEQLILNMTVANGWAFRWVENIESIKIFKYLQPSIKLPGHKVLSSRILDLNSKIIMNDIIKCAKSAYQEVTLTFDG
ncbi:2485_t:CDS:2 [Acaulospora morrowiae]|uniref:2485_t:CDS:1 n=1 Tax=Acaulospora morrowiae TaxID=94023 RepID=A0A9N9A991_9GLOM|nr:2485_t:CDS:2 [Acaulospora morrowiae]